MIKTKRTKDAGFTLIEIIAVLLILAVLAAVAIPRYLSLIEEARYKALQGALSAGYSQLSLTFAKEALSTGNPPSNTELLAVVTDPTGDFGYAFTESGVNVNVEVTDPTDATIKTNGIWYIP